MMGRQLPLWGSVEDDEAVGYVEKCASVGVTRLIGATSAYAVEVAHAKGIAVHPYLGYTAFPTYGNRRISYEWSLPFMRPPVTAPESRAIMDQHRPIWSHPRVAEPEISDFAREHPEYRSYTRDKHADLEPGERLCLSPAFPEVRSHQADLFVTTLAASRGDGIQVEFVLGNEDANGVVPYGYEDRVVEEFRARHGKDAFALPNDDPLWLQFRADHVTLFLQELGSKVKVTFPSARFTTTIIAAEPDEYLKVLQDWPAWVEQGLIDEFHLWFRTNNDLAALARQTAHAAAIIKGQRPLVVELSCYHPGSFQEPDLMLAAARCARANGADIVGVYRKHAVEQLDFWPVLEAIGKL